MATPFVRDPKPLADSLIRYTEDDPTPTSLLANAVRAALHECAEQQALSVDLLARVDDEMARALECGRLYTANKVVHRVTEALERLPEAKDETVRMANVEEWLKTERDKYPPGMGWIGLDCALDDLRDHFHTGTPLGKEVQGPHAEDDR